LRNNLVVEYEGTPVNAVFDSNFNIKELVYETEFVSVILDNLPTNITETDLFIKLDLSSNQVSSWFPIQNKKLTYIKINFTSKVQA
jgi:hypothetical protein